MSQNNTKKAIFTAVIVSLLLPLINVTVFRGPGLLFLTEPMKYPASLADTLEFIYKFFTGALSFLPPLCIANALLTNKNRLSVPMISVFSVPLVYAVMIAEDVIINKKSITSETFKSAGLDWIAVIISYALVYTAIITVKHRSKKAPLEAELFSMRGLLSRGAVISTLVITVISFIQMGFETYVLVVSYGTPDNISQVIELASPYITLLIGAFLAYTAGCTLIMWQANSRKNQAPHK